MPYFLKSFLVILFFCHFGSILYKNYPEFSQQNFLIPIIGHIQDVVFKFQWNFSFKYQIRSYNVSDVSNIKASVYHHVGWKCILSVAI